jgi:hypothetical protein
MNTKLKSTLIAIGVILLLSVFNSCKDESNETNPTWQETIIGTWHLDSTIEVGRGKVKNQASKLEFKKDSMYIYDNGLKLEEKYKYRTNYNMYLIVEIDDPAPLMMKVESITNRNLILSAYKDGDSYQTKQYLTNSKFVPN